MIKIGLMLLVFFQTLICISIDKHHINEIEIFFNGISLDLKNKHNI
jgi:hypothetical protein